MRERKIFLFSVCLLRISSWDIRGLKNHGHIKLYCFRLELLLGHTGAFRCSLYLYIFPAEVSYGGLSDKQEFACPVRAVEVNDRWLSLLNTPYWFEALALIIFGLGNVSITIWLIMPKLFAVITWPVHNKCKRSYPPTSCISLLFLGLQEETWIMLLCTHLHREFWNF